VAGVCDPTTGHLFIINRTSKRQFLANTGSDLWVYPCRLIPRRQECVNYDLCAAIGATIPTYGWLALILQPGTKLGFHVAVRGGRHHISTHWCRLPLSFRLVDCRHHRLLDGVTLLSVTAPAASLPNPSVKTTSGGTTVDSLLAEFPDLTRPTRAQSEVCHNIVLSHPDYARATGHLPTTAIGVGPDRNRQSRV
jgi:hypothetical protein